MVSNTLLLFASVFAIAVVNCKTLETVEESEVNTNDVQDLSYEVEDDVRRRPSRNKTAIAIAAENAAYEKLKDQIAIYNSKVNGTSTAPVDDRFFAIYPGTKWCGAGNIAFGYNNLGLFRSVDMCCRDHDYCSQYINPYTTSYGLYNSGSISKLLCSCDKKFHSCLKSLRTTVANNMGDIYFNMLGSQCFENDYPIISCSTYFTNTNRCNTYNLDTTKPKKYQFFDTPRY